MSWVMRSRQHYCVIQYLIGDVIYEGKSEAACAAALEPGTVYGVGVTKDYAKEQAVRRAAEAKALSDKHDFI